MISTVHRKSFQNIRKRRFASFVSSSFLTWPIRAKKKKNKLFYTFIVIIRMGV